MSTGTIGIAGAGKLGQALARLLVEAGEPVVAVASRNPDHARQGATFAGPTVRAVPLAELASACDRILITAADGAIAEVALRLADAGFAGTAALHVCGALDTGPLTPLSERGISCGVLHPLQTIPSPERGLEALRGICWGVTAGGAASAWADRIVGLLGGRRLDIAAGARALYHAAGVTACNYLIALEDAATAMMEATGVNRSDALAALEPIVSATCRNVFELGPTAALTGPVLRGDIDTVARHLDALAALPETVRDFHRAAARHTITLARRRGLDDDRAEQLDRLLRENSTRNA